MMQAWNKEQNTQIELAILTMSTKTKKAQRTEQTIASLNADSDASDSDYNPDSGRLLTQWDKND